MARVISAVAREKNRIREQMRRAAARAERERLGLVKRPYRQTKENVLSKIRRDGDCWIWTGSVAARGYGSVWWDGKLRRAPRVIYEWHRGPIPRGLELDHLCRVHACVNPAHLEPVLHRVNILRGVGMGARNARKTHCPRGHAYDVMLKRGGRCCLTCRRESNRRSDRRAARRRRDAAAS